eukprot:10497937-Lingulodinium_polyedra.AAC.1
MDAPMARAEPLGAGTCVATLVPAEEAWAEFMLLAAAPGSADYVVFTTQGAVPRQLEYRILEQ